MADETLIKKVLVISVESLLESQSGGVNRTKALAEQLSSVARVMVISPTTQSRHPYTKIVDDIVHLGIPIGKLSFLTGRLGLLPRVGKVHYKAIQNSVLERINLEKPDFILWSHSYLAAVGLKPIRAANPGIKHIIDFPNIELCRLHTFVLNSTGLSDKLSKTLELIKSIYWEKRAAMNSDLNLVVTLNDRSFLSERYKSDSLLLPNGVYRVPEISCSSGSLSLITVANWEYSPNSDGLTEFLSEDWPKILREWPQARLRVCGRVSEQQKFAWSSNQGVELLGFVSNLRGAYATSNLFLAPAKYGAGTQLKVLESLAYGIPVIGPPYLDGQISEQELYSAVYPTTDYVKSIRLLLPNLVQVSALARKESKKFEWKSISRDLLNWVKKS